MLNETIDLIARAPTRIDLAGGTVDLWPIYLLLDDARTVNLGISLFAETHLSWVKNGPDSVVLESADQSQQAKLSWKDLRSDSPSQPQSGPTIVPALELHFRLLREFVRRYPQRAGGELKLSTRAKSPAGAGLGGSSTLSVSIVRALDQGFSGSTTPPGDLIELVRDIETQVIQVPAGVQDYYGAMFGGLQSLRWRVGKHARVAIPVQEKSAVDSTRWAANRVALFYSGQSRNSGINNWALFKSFIDRDAAVRDAFAQIVRATHELEAALHRADAPAAAHAIDREWVHRRKLAAGITTAEIDHAFELAHEVAGPGVAAGKICGAGGGGCFFVWVGRNDDREAAHLREAICQKVTSIPGVRRLEFDGIPDGVSLENLKVNE